MLGDGHGIRFSVGFFIIINMSKKELEQLKESKEKEAKLFYESNDIKMAKNPNTGYYPVYPYFSLNEKVETKTIRLSNSTTPMACY